MARIVGALIAFALVFAIFKLVIIALVVAGLIFRTKETIFLLLIGGLLSLIAAFPVAGLGLLAIIVVAAIVNVARKQPSRDQPEPTLLRIKRDLDDPDQE